MLRRLLPFIFLGGLLLTLSISSLAITKRLSVTGKAAPRPATPRKIIRGEPGDLWADIVIGKRDFTEIAAREIAATALNEPGGIAIDHQLRKAYIWDSGNNRVVAVDLATCLPSAYGSCVAEKVFGQAGLLDQGACNRDSSFQTYPNRPNSSASTLCGVREDTVTTLEDKSFSSIYVDEDTHDLYVPDVKNNRVLLYRDPYATDTIADDVWGQNDMTGNLCNQGAATPSSSSLCFQASFGDGNGVVISPERDYLWISDGGNHRVLGFPKSGNTYSKTAAVVIGQSDFTSNILYSDETSSQAKKYTYSPSTLRFGANRKLYIADVHQQGKQYGRVLIFDNPPTANFAAATGVLAGPFSGHPLSLEVDPVVDGANPTSRGIWVFDHGGTAIQPLTNITLWGYNSKRQDIIIGPYTRDGGTINDTDDYGYVQIGSGAFAIDYLPADQGRPSVFTTTYSGSINANKYTRLPSGNWSQNWRFFQQGYNIMTARRFDHPSWAGVAVSNNQLAVSDRRLLIWNNVSGLTNGAAPNYFLGTNSITEFSWPEYGSVKAANNRLWAARKSAIEIYNLPITQSKQIPTKIIGSLTGQPTTLPVLGGGTITINYDNNFVSAIAPTSDGAYLWATQTNLNRVIRIKNPLTSPIVDVIIGQANTTDSQCNRGQSSPGLNTLCTPGALGLDIYGNLYISDHFIEVSGNHRLLEYSATLFNNVTTLLTNVSATKEFPSNNSLHMNFGTAFDSRNRLVVGNNPYSGRRFVDYYLDPLKKNPANPSDPAFAVPDGQLNDYYGWPVAITFDSQDNLYVYDPNRGKVSIYFTPFITSPAPDISPSPLPTCVPRPACLDLRPACKIGTPPGGWCPTRTTPPPTRTRPSLSPPGRILK